MKFVGVREAQARLSALVDQSQRERIVLTRHGQPVAVLAGVRGEDLEDLLLSRDPELRRLLADRRRYQGPLVSHRALEAEATSEVARERPRAYRRMPARRKGPPGGR
jgi:prevent-host-death family protein